MVKVKETVCPNCKNTLDAASPVKKKQTKPSPGDLSICAYCHSGLAFTETLGLRLANDQELDLLWTLLCDSATEETSIASNS